MRSSTLYFRPPETRKPAKAKSGWGEIARPLFRYRVELTPILVAFTLAMGTAIVTPHVPFAFPAFLIVCGALVWQFGDKIKIPDTTIGRQIKIYVVAVFGIMAAWSFFSTLGADSGKPGFKWLLILVLGMYPLAAPWLRYNNRRSAVMVTFSDDVPYRLRRKMSGMARAVVLGWHEFTRASSAAGSNLRSIHFDPWSVTLNVRLGHARVAEDFTQLRLRRLESAFEATRDSARVEDMPGKSARLARIRFMLSDPHAEPIVPTDEDLTPDNELTVDIGRFENNVHVIMDLVHTLIAGASGAGKSGIINAIMRALAHKKNVAVVGIDMKPGGLELGKWADVLFALATNGLEAKILLQTIIKGIERRGQIMKERGIRKWKPTPEEPFIVLIVDEVHQLKEHRLFPLLVKVSELARAYGFALIMATQHPKDSSVPTEAIANCTQRIGLQCNASTAERLIFDDNATREGWRLTILPGDREGTFLIRSKRYRRPLRARAHWLDDVDVERYAEAFRTALVEIDSATWTGEITHIGSPPMIEPPDDDEESDVVDAVIVESDPQEVIFMAIAAGHGTTEKIVEATKISRAQVTRMIRRLADDGRITQDGARKPWRIVR